MEYMTDIERFSLINGEFLKDEARDILLGMINYKISFHELRNFGSSIQHGQQNDLSVRRIQELEETRNQILKFFSSLDDSGKLKITSKIIIEYAR
jgi:hypothetical protein